MGEDKYEKNGTGGSQMNNSSSAIMSNSNKVTLDFSSTGGEPSAVGGTSTTGNITADVSLPDAVLDKLYHNYSIKQRRSALDWFLVASILFDIWALAVPQGQSYAALGITCIVLVINVSILIFLRVFGDGKLQKTAYEVAPHIVWLLAILQLFLYLLFKTPVTARDFLGWGILLNFLVYVTLPVPLLYTGILFGIGSLTIFMSTVIGLSKREAYFWEQQGANIVLVLAAATIGLLYYFLGESKQKRAFLEARKSLEVKMVIEEQSAEQERLLLSVLPEHVAVKMRQDLGSTNSEQFKKIYMSRHENVSILYADIVGFTAISSTYSAQDLVKMLNELFARFDRLAEKYHQLRIKILGDCYYCISGAPVERPDHAVLCVHMGLSMVKAIKYVQQKTNSPVDMRVGIHTGAVLAGILGQRQWQFDVYSKDVELANKMESSGKAGRVHISEKTLGFLSGEFEVEPAFGEKREEALRIAGLKTYFITKVVKPFVPSSENKRNGTTNQANRTADSIEELSSDDFPDDDDGKACSGDEECNANEEDKEEDFKQRLRKELVSRDGHREISKDTTIFLGFKSKELEKAYSIHREPYSSVPLVASLLVQLVDIIYSTLVLPRTCLHYAIITAPLILIAPLVFVSVAESFPGILSDILVRISKKFNDIICLRRFTAILIVLLVGSSNLTDMYFFAIAEPTKTDSIGNATTILDNSTLGGGPSPGLMSQSTPTFILDQNPSRDNLLYPSYMSNFGVLILISIAVIAQLTHICKIILMSLITALHCAANIFILEEKYKYEGQLVWNIGLPMRYNVSAVLVLVAVALSFLARYMDKEDRVIFKWKTEVAEQKEKVSDMRRRNEALVYNVLPVHVAEHFMKNRKRSHEDLYSQSYAEVGVLFASMPNFSDFYSEETVNNQGLECLRFLNEVISDYDALLELPQFQDIIKIKTIGSTYMAASGLNPSRQVKPDDPIIVRWAHLALLVEFALELKKALQGINEQSFNHFVLKMGINHGPITAGVIGARKPHYDIWGNTVNVASRMESTGKAGAIQVTEETCQILQTFGYTFEQRGLVAVKGKGQLMTYYLQGKSMRPNPPSSPMLSNINTMETLPEVEEPNESPKFPTTTTNTTTTPLANTTTDVNSLTPTSPTMNSSSGTCRGGGNGSGGASGSGSGNKNGGDTALNITLTAQEIQRNESFDDPRSPKNASFNINAFTDSILLGNDKLSMTTPSVKQNGVDSSELDLDIDAKTPLLNLNSTNLDSSRDFNASEKDSLIANE